MDPNLFAVDGERLFEVLMMIIVLSFLLERALAIPFEHRWLGAPLARKGLKEPITVAVAFLICRHWDFDALSVLLVRENTELWGHLLTAAIVAGGSKASIKLFHDVLNTMSNAELERRKVKDGLGPAVPVSVAPPAPAPSAAPQPPPQPAPAPSPAPGS